MDIKKLNDVRISDKNIFGSKAANLGYLLSKGFNVPYGIVIGMKNKNDYDIDEIKKYLKQDKLYSVRSSSTIEDGEDYSFAGQFETVLGVSIDKLEENINKVSRKTLKVVYRIVSFYLREKKSSSTPN